MKPVAAAAIALALIAAPALATAPAHADTPRTTIIFTPHPDDETIRLTGYASYAQARGDRLILVAVTDGSATYLTNCWGWTGQMMAESRTLEQDHAWAAVTKGTGTVIRLHLPDGNVAPSTSVVTQEADTLVAQYGPTTEIYVAADSTDAHPDHRATVAGVEASTAKVVRTALDRGNHAGMAYAPADPGAAALASNSYHDIGWLSVPDEFQNLASENYTSYVR